MYNPKSLKAEEFIEHQEVLSTLEHASKNKNDLQLVDQILAKARLKKGLTHQEAAVLLDCDDTAKVKEIFDLAEQLKKEFLRQPNCHFCTAISIQLLCERLRLLSLSF